MVRFLADAALNHAVVTGCRRREPLLDFRSANEAGLEGLPDTEVLAMASEQNRILVTSDFRTMPWHFAQFLETQGNCQVSFL